MGEAGGAEGAEGGDRGYQKILSTVPGARSTQPVALADGGQWTIKPRSLTAAEWIKILTEDFVAWHRVLAAVLPASQAARLASLLASGDLLADEAVEASQKALESAAGRPWWEVFSILAIAEEAWEGIGGELAIHGANPASLTLGSWLDAVWHLLKKLAAQRGESVLNQMVSDVKRPPLSGENEENWEMDAAEFMAAASELRGQMLG
jgi:hypothetical protein